jgi:hypothetical protein
MNIDLLAFSEDYDQMLQIPGLVISVIHIYIFPVDPYAFKIRIPIKVL